jgi:hypothetical protein
MDGQQGGAGSDALIAYITWNRVVPWKILSLPDRPEADFFPMGYGSDQRTLKHRAKKGTTLWVVTLPWVETQPRQGVEPRGSVQVTTYPFFFLVARLDIAGVYKCWSEVPLRLRSRGVRELLEDWGWVAVAAHRDRAVKRNGERVKGKESRFYGFNNVNKVLEKHHLIEPGDLKDARLVRRRIGARLQSIRVIEGKADQLEKDFNEILDPGKGGKGQIFISFKSEDNFHEALRLAEALTHLGFNCWLDSFAIPLYSRRRVDEIAQERLRQLIRWGIKKSDLAIVFVSPLYAQGENGYWTDFEQSEIKTERSCRQSFRAYGILDRVKLPDRSEKTFDETSPKLKSTEMARAIVQWFEGS